MTIRARVEQIIGCEVTVKYCENTDCSACTGCSHGFEKREIVVKAFNAGTLPLNEGDIVELFLSPWKAIKAGFLVLIFPLLMFFPLYLAATGPLGIENEAVSILFGIGGIVLGFLINLILKNARKKQDLPEITRVLDSATFDTIPFENAGERNV
jgi:positive regulator of sigma E activity